MAAALGMWWVWVAGGLLIGIVEVFAPGFFFLGFSGGAIATGLLVAVWPGLGLPVLVTVFALCSVAVWLGLRRIVGVRKGQFKRIDHDINEN